MNTLVNNFTALASPRNSMVPIIVVRRSVLIRMQLYPCQSLKVILQHQLTKIDLLAARFTRGSHQSDSSSSGSSSSSSSSDGNSTSSSSGGGSHSGGSGSISTTSTNANVSNPTGSSTDASSMSTRRFGCAKSGSLWSQQVKVTVIKHECDRGRLSERHSSTACRRFHTQYAGSVRYGVLSYN